MKSFKQFVENRIKSKLGNFNVDDISQLHAAADIEEETGIKGSAKRYVYKHFRDEAKQLLDDWDKVDRQINNFYDQRTAHINNILNFFPYFYDFFVLDKRQLITQDRSSEYWKIEVNDLGEALSEINYSIKILKELTVEIQDNVSESIKPLVHQTEDFIRKFHLVVSQEIQNVINRSKRRKR